MKAPCLAPQVTRKSHFGSIIVNPRWGGCAVNPKIVQKSRNNILLKSFREVSAYFRAVSAYFRELAHIFGKLVHIFARNLVSRTSKQVSKNLGPLWQPGVYNDTNTLGTLPKIVNHHLGPVQSAPGVQAHTHTHGFSSAASAVFHQTQAGQKQQFGKDRTSSRSTSGSSECFRLVTRTWLWSRARVNLGLGKTWPPTGSKSSKLGRWIRTDLGVRTFQSLGRNSPNREQVVRRINRDLHTHRLIESLECEPHLQVPLHRRCLPGLAKPSNPENRANVCIFICICIYIYTRVQLVPRFWPFSVFFFSQFYSEK